MTTMMTASPVPVAPLTDDEKGNTWVAKGKAPDRLMTRRWRMVAAIVAVGGACAALLTFVLR